MSISDLMGVQDIIGNDAPDGTPDMDLTDDVTPAMNAPGLEDTPLAEAMAGKDGKGARVSSDVVTSLLRDMYANLSPEELTQLDEHVKELEAWRDNRALGVRNISLAAFHDTRITMDNVHQEVRSVVSSTSR